MTEARARAGWLDVAEVGSLWGSASWWACASSSAAAARACFLRGLVGYYVLFNGTARRLSTYLRRVLGHATFGMAYRHLCTFAEVALDRLLFASGKFGMFEVTSTGNEHLNAARSSGVGALLLGAPWQLRGHARPRKQRVSAHQHGGELPQRAAHEAVVDKLDPQLRTRFISVADGGLDFVLTIRECIERGEMVAILADRVGPDAREDRGHVPG